MKWELTGDDWFGGIRSGISQAILAPCVMDEPSFLRIRAATLYSQADNRREIAPSRCAPMHGTKITSLIAAAPRRCAAGWSAVVIKNNKGSAFQMERKRLEPEAVKKLVATHELSRLVRKLRWSGMEGHRLPNLM
jgi:hypothetical protein